MKPEIKVKLNFKNNCTYLYVLKLHLSLRVLRFYESTPIPAREQAKQPVLVLFTSFQLIMCQTTIGQIIICN
jgi:hypothetical protein